ncbi:WD domain G-beta repeat protein [Trichostrongylus colubriformis]|uniref:Elongator complex protein 2 n=1 Tax=Trichostrongylus colubriformis TaxID=6319 RepID=A0AAN8GF12_TRICO
MPSGVVLLALGTTKRCIDLYCETACVTAMERVLSITAHDDWVHSIAFNQSCPVLLATAGQDSYVKLWRIEEETKKTDVDELNVTKNSFKVAHADGKLSLSISAEAVLSGHDDWVHSTSWDSTGRILLTSSSDKTVIIWKESHDEKLWSDAVRLGIVGGQAAGFFSAAFSPDARQIVASSYFGGLYAWQSQEVDVWNAAPVCSGHVGAVRDVAWHPDGRMLISVGEDKTTRVYITEKKEKKFIEVARPQVHGHSMQCIAVVSRSVIVTGAEEKIFRAFQTPKAFAKMYAIAVNPAGTVLATSCKASQTEDAAISLWDTSDWSKKSEVHGHTLTVTQLEWCPAGTLLLSVSRDRKAILYREQNGDLNGFSYEKVWSSTKQHSRIIWSCCWFEDSQHFVTASRDMQVIVWKCNDENTTPVSSFKCPQAVTSVAVCCGTELRDVVIATGLQDGSVLLLSLLENQLRPISHSFVPSLTVDSPIIRIRVNPRNRCEMAVAGGDGKLRVLRLTTNSA